MEQQAPAAPPQTLGGLVAYLSVSDAAAAAKFYERAFGAVEVNRMTAGDDPRLVHCHLHINGSSLMLSDPFPEHGHPHKPPQAFSLVLMCDDIDAMWARAVDAGAEVVQPLQLMFWGDRYGALRDPFGVDWAMNAPVKR